jgi:hypothetical protein
MINYVEKIRWCYQKNSIFIMSSRVEACSNIAEVKTTYGKRLQRELLKYLKKQWQREINFIILIFNIISQTLRKVER